MKNWKRLPIALALCMLFALPSSSAPLGTLPDVAISDVTLRSALLPNLASAMSALETRIAGIQDQVQPPADPPADTTKHDVTTITTTETRTWFVSPVWIAVGVVGALFLIILIVLAVRGPSTGGTTIVHEK